MKVSILMLRVFLLLLVVFYLLSLFFIKKLIIKIAFINDDDYHNECLLR